MERSLTLLNEMGDTTLTWPEENDAEMQAIIEKKMAAGVTFYLITKAGKPSKRKLKEAADATKHRALSIPDQDFSKFVLEGKGEAVPFAGTQGSTTKRATSAREVATGRSVGVQPRRGG